MWDLLIRAGCVIDGTGAAPVTADVAVQDGRIVAIGALEGDARETFDADGLTVTPGFVDIHTHYDAQLHWEPTASPSSWHGVTTVLMGNCGFTLAPSKPEDLPWLSQMLSRVEGMSADTLAEAVTFRGGSYAEFLAGLDGRIGVNAAGNVGHCAVRRMVMGDEASERAADDAEIDAMARLVRAALHDGAIGFTSSQLDIHMAHDGRPVPSNLAAPDELIALAGVLGDFDHGSIEFIPRTFLEGYSDGDRELIRAMARASKKPINLNTLTRMWNAPDGWKRSLAFAQEAEAEGLAVHPMFATNRQGAHFSLDNTFLFDELPSFRATLTLPSPQREARLREPAVRDQMRRELSDPTGRSFVFVWEVLRVERVSNRDHEWWVGRSVTEVAGEMALDPLDCFLDISLAEGLATQFVLQGPPDKQRTAATEELIRSPLVMAGSSDAGAHLLSFCGVDFTTRLLTEWVPDTLSFEAAVARLTSVPARAHGLGGRGVIAEGAAADLLVLDRTRLAVGETRYVRDFPAASGRYVVDASGYVATIVNGKVLLEEGKHTGALPGHVVRGPASRAVAR